MALFPISSNAVQLNTTTPTAADQFSNGIRLKADNSAVFAALSGGGQYQNGFLLDANGAVICVDATSSLPAGTQYTNGLPISPAGALCVSTGPVDEWIGGLPFAANGALAAAGLVVTDPFYANVSLLLHFDGTNGSTTFTDNSPSPKTATVSGNAQISTTSPLFGTGCGLFDGTGDRVQFAANAGFAFGAGDFTVEVAYKPASSSTDQCIVYYGADSSGFNSDFCWILTYLGLSSAGKVRFTGFYAGESFFSITSTNALSTSAYNVIAVSRVSSAWKLLIGGALEGSATNSNTLNTPSSPILRIGQYQSTNTLYANGRMDELRITKGVGRYTGAYAVDTSAFPNS